MVLVLKIFFKKMRSQSYDPKIGEEKTGPIKRFLTIFFQIKSPFWGYESCEKNGKIA